MSKIMHNPLHSSIGLIYSLFILFSSCSKDKIDFVLQEKGIWENEKEAKVHELLQVGTDNMDKTDYFFGFISDISTDYEDNLYILDYRNCKVSKFSSDGEFIATYGNGKGQGPGEFQNPVGVCIDLSGNVYVSDRNTWKISVFDFSGKFINSFRTEKIAPLHDIIAHPANKLLVGVDVRKIESADWKGGIFQIYSLPEETLSGSVGKSWKKRNTLLHVGSNSVCVNDTNGEIIVSYALPYLIEIFSREGSFVRRFGRKASFFDEVWKDKYGNILACGSSNGVLCLPDGKIINIIRQWIVLPDHERQLKIYLDFFDKNGKYLISVPGEKIGSYRNNDFTKASSDSQGNIWVKYEEPYPHVKKYRIEFIDKSV